jgi:O-acetyl-ADP-ribose deacetylase (regulator of RNase III)
MTNIHYTVGDATDPKAGGNKIICHVCNDVGGWGAGFVLALSKRWPQPEAAYRAWHQDRERNDFALGAVQLVKVEPEIWVANLVGQHDIRRNGVTPLDGQPPVRYEAIEAALVKVSEEAKKLRASVHMPRIGCGLAGGTWDKMEPIIERTMGQGGVDVFVYDLV